MSNNKTNTTIKKEIAPFSNKEAEAVEKMSVSEMVSSVKSAVVIPEPVKQSVKEEVKEEETVIAVAPTPKKNKFNICPMGAVEVKNASLYRGKGFDFIRKITGKLFLFDAINYNGYYKVCKSVNDAASNNSKAVIGYISINDIQ